MRTHHALKSKFKNTFLSIMLSVALLVTLTPTIALTTPVHALDYNSQYYAEKMQQYQAQIDELTPQYTQAVQTENSALTTMNNAKSTMDGYKNTIDTAEPTLNKKTREYIDQKVTEAWTRDLATFKSKNPTKYYQLKKAYEDKYGSGYYDNKRVNYYRPEWLIDTAETYIETNKDLFENKYNTTDTYGKRMYFLEKKKQGGLREAYYEALSYENVLAALDQIDECNRIRGSQSELAKYWTGVKGQSVPSNIKQLKVSPYMMSVSAMSVVVNLNTDFPLSHILGQVSTGFTIIVDWQTAGGQNIHRSTGANPALPWWGWWDRENDAKMEAHNSNIADPDYTQCGFGRVKYYAETGSGGNSQDFVGVNDSLYPGITVANYRSGLKSYCGSTLTAWENAKSKYDGSVTAHNNAVKAYNTAKKNAENLLKQLNDAKANYNSAKNHYEYCLQLENESNNKTYTVSFKARPTGEIFHTETVVRGGSCNYPTPPVIEGYTFSRWNMEPTNIMYDTVIAAIYTKNDSNGGANPSTGGNEPQTQYTVTVIRSYDAGVIKTYTVNAGDTLRTNDIEFDNYDGWVARRLKCSADDLKNIQSNLIVAVEYYKASEVVTEYAPNGSYFGIDFDLGKPVWHESIVRPTSGSGPVTIKNNNSGSSIVLEREDPSPSTTAKVDLSKVGYTKTIKALPKNGFAYNGKAIGITKYRVPYYEKDGKAYALNYKVSYTRNNRIGTATATFTPTDKSKFTGTVKTTFRIVPKKPAFKTVKMTKSTSQIKVKAVKGGVKYQYQIRTGKGKWKTVKSKKTTYKFTKLKGKKLYQIRVRAYKKVGKKTYYSPWNTVKLKTVKKTKKFR